MVGQQGKLLNSRCSRMAKTINFDLGDSPLNIVSALKTFFFFWLCLPLFFFLLHKKSCTHANPLAPPGIAGPDNIAVTEPLKLKTMTRGAKKMQIICHDIQFHASFQTSTSTSNSSHLKILKNPGLYQLQGYVRYIFAHLFLGLNESTCQIKKNIFYFTSKPLFALEKIKFQNSAFSNFMIS